MQECMELLQELIFAMTILGQGIGQCSPTSFYSGDMEAAKEPQRADLYFTQMGRVAWHLTVRACLPSL